MRRHRGKTIHGFTIVELLIVIVIIAILAVITIVAYNGVTNKAHIAALQSDLTQYAKAFEATQLESGAYPANQAAANLTADNNITWHYYTSNATNYCLEGTSSGISYAVSNAQQSPAKGDCSTSGMVAWWTLNNSLNDSIGGLNGTIGGTGSSIVTGANGQANSAYALNGTAFISLPSGTPALNLTNSDITVSAWVNLSVSPPTASWDDIVAGSSGDWGFGIDGGSSGSGYARFTEVQVADAPNSTIGITTGTWHNLIGVYDATSHTVTYYLDGANDGSATATINHTGTTKTLGARINGTSSRFNGSLDDVRVYGRALTPSEAQEIYNDKAA